MSFVSKGEKKMRNSPANSAGGSEAKAPVSEAMQAKSYDPATRKRVKNMAELREAAKKITQRSMAGDASPTGSQGGQDAKHTSSSSNKSGLMKGGGGGSFEKLSKKRPKAANVDGDEGMEDPYDQEEEDSGQTEEGMTPMGKKRKMDKGAMRKKRSYADFV